LEVEGEVGGWRLRVVWLFNLSLKKRHYPQDSIKELKAKTVKGLLHANRISLAASTPLNLPAF
jgi:hypothetical protein